MHKELSVDVRSSKHLGKPETIKIAEDKKEAPTKPLNSDVDTLLNLRPSWSFKKDDVVDYNNKEKKISREMEGSRKKGRRSIEV